MKEKRKQRILFCTGISRAFRTTSIANLYELSQVFPVVLLSEKLDSETEEILKDKKLFPKLEEIMSVEEVSELQKTNLFIRNRRAHRLAKQIIKKYKPTILILSDDYCLFGIYLMRFAKKNNAINAVLNSDLRFWKAKEMSLRTDLTHAYFDLPSFLPFTLRMFLVRARKYCGYLLYNFFLPLSVGEAPFWGRSSRILYTISGLRADWRIVFSKEDYNLSLEEGVSQEKLILLEHPIKREATKRFFKKVYLADSGQVIKNGYRVLTLFYPEEPYGFKRTDCSLISEKEILKERVKIVQLIADTLKDWKIFIKPHPAVQKAEELKKIFEDISRSVVFINPSEPADKYIEASDTIVGLPPISSVLFTAALQCPGKPIFSLDLPSQEILGDCYKNSDLVEYIDSQENLIKVLELIRDNTERNAQYAGHSAHYNYHKEKDLTAKGFESTVDVMDYLFKKQIR